MALTLAELKNAIDGALQIEKKPEYSPVVISITSPYPAFGPSPGVVVRCAGMGLDWESGQFRIEPDEELMAIKNQPEIVRCKDCLWYDEKISFCDNCHLPREQTFFCADGKRKDS